MSPATPMPRPGALPYVYLLAASHSGSTLLGLLANAHPDVVSIGEMVSGSPRALEGYRCSCRLLITDCPFWKAVGESMADQGVPFNLVNFGIEIVPPEPAWLNRALRLEHRGPLLEAMRDLVLAASPAWRRHFPEVARRVAAFAQTVTRLRGAKVLVDSSKLAHRLKFMKRVDSLDLKVVRLVRDGRAVALTYMNEQAYADAADPSLRRGGRGEAPVRAKGGMTMERAAEEWRRCQEAAEFVLADLPKDRWMRISYEQLCTHTAPTLQAVFRFMGVDPERRVDDFRRVAHHIVGNGMRLDRTSEIRLDERWRDVLTPRDLAIFDTVAGDLNRRLGYQ